MEKDNEIEEFLKDDEENAGDTPIENPDNNSEKPKEEKHLKKEHHSLKTEHHKEQHKKEHHTHKTEHHKKPEQASEEKKVKKCCTIWCIVGIVAAIIIIAIIIFASAKPATPLEKNLKTEIAIDSEVKPQEAQVATAISDIDNSIQDMKKIIGG